ncbi:putative leucine-rich repeat domain superfamily [Helianthus annuus]|uniref:Leucine-rich repeat domain superfamily n=1 Tax=Helianthus annuus TaxID=4232 RepID=A0A9K3GS10_HELAN|nr:putative leucine-rich repeat domain superfamily [Helianthus annuus]KAJ0427740.1 putative leucine-rich repeat domain superfamily [Helianthus annuus]KAJ0431603.1 putative leucine-rich repeat domain superfamily [Helianthus annuus]KAJ0446030.1 putative leucine-rich repeat domain superfamily [Helianthus annuus]KAJ0630977.1 putative leucine-rich repeat domain superfamily [Helianthus annuus]
MGDRKRVNVEGDRLSSLPDDLIHKILSFVSIKCAVETSVKRVNVEGGLSGLQCLTSVSQVMISVQLLKFLRWRNNQIEVFSVDLTFRGKVSQAFVKRILDYAFSHNVQQLNFTCLRDKKIELPLSLFSSRSLKHLSLTGYSSCSYEHCIMTPPTWELPALATLNLHRVTLHDNGASHFSHCANLKNLTIKRCSMMGLGTSTLSICHLGLFNLTFEDGWESINVVTPQLKNLTIKDWPGIHLISAPNLSSLHYKDLYYDDPLQLSTDLLYLEKANICIHCPSEDKAATHKIVCLLQQLHTVKFLTLCLS